MNRNKLSKIKQRISDLRNQGGIKPRELEKLAEALGRKRHPRGSEPTWVNEDIPDLRPVSIPRHKELNKYTAKSILNCLEHDVERLEQELN